MSLHLLPDAESSLPDGVIELLIQMHRHQALMARYYTTEMLSGPPDAVDYYRNARNEARATTARIRTALDDAGHRDAADMLATETDAAQ